MKFSYFNSKVPKDYKCGECSKRGAKLWREYNTFGPRLFCCDCAAKNQKYDISDIDAEGKFSCKQDNLDGLRTDQIGWLVPAVPDEEGVGYWGYTSVPQSGVEWWHHLPTR